MYIRNICAKSDCNNDIFPFQLCCLSLFTMISGLQAIRFRTAQSPLTVKCSIEYAYSAFQKLQNSFHLFNGKFDNQHKKYYYKITNLFEKLRTILTRTFLKARESNG